MDIQLSTTKKVILLFLGALFLGVLFLFINSEYSLKQQQESNKTTLTAVPDNDAEQATSSQSATSKQLPITPQEKAIVEEREHLANIVKQAKASNEELAKEQEKLKLNEQRAQAAIESLDAQVNKKLQQ